MNKKLIRPYEMSVWSLQDEFITVLKSHDIANKGQLISPPHDDPADTLYELLGEDPYLCRVLGGFLPQLRGADHGLPLLRRHGGGCPGFAAAEKDGLPGQAGALCHGAAQLPYALGQERLYAPVG